MAAEPKRSRGRPATITPAVVEEIAGRIALGLTHEQAASLSGVKLPAWTKALERHPEFVEVVKDRSAEYVESALHSIRAGARGWQGAAWILERRHKAQFGRADIHVEASATAGAINFTIPEKLLEEIASMPPPARASIVEVKS